jgi:hypothetical protein
MALSQGPQARKTLRQCRFAKRKVYDRLDNPTKQRIIADPVFANELIRSGKAARTTVRSIQTRAGVKPVSQRLTKNGLYPVYQLCEDVASPPSPAVEMKTQMDKLESSDDMIHAMVSQVTPWMSKSRQFSLEKFLQAILDSQSIRPSRIADSQAALTGTRVSNARRQLDYYLSNDGIFSEGVRETWYKSIVNGLEEVIISIDFTDFDKADQTTFVACVELSDKQCVPATWGTVNKSKLKGGTKKRLIRQILTKIRQWTASDVPVIVVGDREFGTVPYLQLYTSIGLRYCCRSRDKISVAHGNQTMPPKRWLVEQNIATHQDSKRSAEPVTRTAILQPATVTKKNAYAVQTVVIHKEAQMKGMWTIVTDLPNVTVRRILDLYADRWSIETFFKHTKDLCEGLGFSQVRFLNVETANLKRDRLWFLVAMAHRLWNGLGKASESLQLNKLVEAAGKVKAVVAATQKTDCLSREDKRLVTIKRELSLTRLGRKVYKYIQTARPQTKLKVGKAKPTGKQVKAMARQVELSRCAAQLWGQAFVFWTNVAAHWGRSRQYGCVCAGLDNWSP